MHSKNNNKTQSFVQGLRPFSKTIPKTLKKHLRKGGYNYSNIVDNWTKMVSKKIADACYPITVKMGKEMREGTLVLNVIHGKELEVEYKKNEIMDKINSFFGKITQCIFIFLEKKVLNDAAGVNLVSKGFFEYFQKLHLDFEEKYLQVELLQYCLCLVLVEEFQRW